MLACILWYPEAARSVYDGLFNGFSYLICLLEPGLKCSAYPISMTSVLWFIGFWKNLLWHCLRKQIFFLVWTRYCKFIVEYKNVSVSFVMNSEVAVGVGAYHWWGVWLINWRLSQESSCSAVSEILRWTSGWKRMYWNTKEKFAGRNIRFYKES